MWEATNPTPPVFSSHKFVNLTLTLNAVKGKGKNPLLARAQPRVPHISRQSFGLEMSEATNPTPSSRSHKFVILTLTLNAVKGKGKNLLLKP
jgi:hypothetical protein